MTATDLKNLLERVQAWPEAAQEELVSIANQIESELQGKDYQATQEELIIIDAAMASIDGVNSRQMLRSRRLLQNFVPPEARFFASSF